MQAQWADVVARDPDGLGGVRSPRPLMPRACAAFSKANCYFEVRKKELAKRPLIREQASGELERLGRYQVHLDLAILLRLMDPRRVGVEA
jgi:hypothetical protein